MSSNERGPPGPLDTAAAAAGTAMTTSATTPPSATSNLSSATASAPGSTPRSARRGPYKCGRCGQLLKGHVCPFKGFGGPAEAAAAAAAAAANGSLALALSNFGQSPRPGGGSVYGSDSDTAAAAALLLTASPAARAQHSQHSQHQRRASSNANGALFLGDGAGSPLRVSAASGNLGSPGDSGLHQHYTPHGHSHSLPLHSHASPGLSHLFGSSDRAGLPSTISAPQGTNSRHGVYAQSPLSPHAHAHMNGISLPQSGGRGGVALRPPPSHGAESTEDTGRMAAVQLLSLSKPPPAGHAFAPGELGTDPLARFLMRIAAHTGLAAPVLDTIFREETAAAMAERSREQQQQRQHVSDEGTANAHGDGEVGVKAAAAAVPTPGRLSVLTMALVETLLRQRRLLVMDQASGATVPLDGMTQVDGCLQFVFGTGEHEGEPNDEAGPGTEQEDDDLLTEPENRSVDTGAMPNGQAGHIELPTHEHRSEADRTAVAVVTAAVVEKEEVQKTATTVPSEPSVEVVQPAKRPKLALGDA